MELYFRSWKTISDMRRKDIPADFLLSIPARREGETNICLQNHSTNNVLDMTQSQCMQCDTCNSIDYLLSNIFEQF